ncbi:hypothetical protein Tco_1084515, partial [Tanacetum coccineum]
MYGSPSATGGYVSLGGSSSPLVEGQYVSFGSPPLVEGRYMLFGERTVSSVRFISFGGRTVHVVRFIPSGGRAINVIRSISEHIRPAVRYMPSEWCNPFRYDGMSGVSSVERERQRVTSLLARILLFSHVVMLVACRKCLLHHSFCFSLRLSSSSYQEGFDSLLLGQRVLDSFILPCRDVGCMSKMPPPPLLLMRLSHQPFGEGLILGQGSVRRDFFRQPCISMACL